VQAVAVDGAGNVTVAGSFESSVDFGAGAVSSSGGTDVFVAGYTPAGAYRWSRAFGSSAAETVAGIGVDATGNVYIAGTLKGIASYGGGTLNWSGGSDLFVVSYDGAGVPRWGKGLGDGGYQNATGLSVDVTGNMYLNGTYDGKIMFGGGTTVTAVEGFDAFAASLNSQGGPRWAESWNYGTSVWYDYGDSITHDALGNAYHAWHTNYSNQLYIVSLDAAGAQRWSKYSSISAMGSNVYGMASGGGALYSVGGMNGTLNFGTGITSAGGLDAFVVSHDAGGTHRWSKRFGGAGEDVWRDVAVDGAGDVYVVGCFSGTVDFGGGAMTSSGGKDLAVVKLSGATGAHIFSWQLGGAGNDVGMSIALDGSGNIYLAGSFESSMPCAGTSLVSGGMTDAMLVKLHP
jgi:hypothetical protein